VYDDDIADTSWARRRDDAFDDGIADASRVHRRGDAFDDGIADASRAGTPACPYAPHSMCTLRFNDRVVFIVGIDGGAPHPMGALKSMIASCSSYTWMATNHNV
jgi:hypothetical protein